MTYKVIKKTVKGDCKSYIQEVLTFDNDEQLQQFCVDNKKLTKDFCYTGKNKLTKNRYDLEYTIKNALLLRNNQNELCNKEYTICVACGKSLHQHNKNKHITTKFGIVGDACYKKLLTIL